MKAVVLGLLALALSAAALNATPITGNVAIAGASTYTLSGIHFDGPAFVLIGTGSFLPDVGSTFPIHNLTFAAPGIDLFATGSGISMDLVSLSVIQNSTNFLNILGTADMMQAGFDTTLYSYSLTATRPDGVSSFTLTAVPAVVPEPSTLILCGSALLAAAVVLQRRKKRHEQPDLSLPV